MATLREPQGGTNQTSYTDGELLIGKTDGTLNKSTLTAGDGITINNGDGTIEIVNSGTEGTPQDNAVWWSSVGDNGNDGRSLEEAKADPQEAVTLAETLSPTAANRITVHCEDGARYTQTVTISDAHVDIYAPSAILNGSITLGTDAFNNSINFYEYDANTGNCIVNNANTVITLQFIKFIGKYLTGGTSVAVINNTSSAVTTIYDIDYMISGSGVEDVIDVQSGTVIINSKFLGTGAKALIVKNGTTVYLNAENGFGEIEVQSGGTLYLNIKNPSAFTYDFQASSTTYWVSPAGGHKTFTDGQLLIGKTDGSLAKNTLTAGAGINISNGNGTITVTADGTEGTPQDNAVWWSSVGDSGNDGRSLEEAKADPQEAINLADTLSPSVSNQITVNCEDGKRYGGINLNSVSDYINVFAPDAHLRGGTNSLGGNNTITINSISASTIGGSVIAFKDSAGSTYLYAKKIYDDLGSNNLPIDVQAGVLYSNIDEIQSFSSSIDGIRVLGGVIYHSGKKMQGGINIDANQTGYINIENYFDGDITIGASATTVINIGSMPSGKTITIASGAIGVLNIDYKPDGSTGITNNSSAFKINIKNDSSNNTTFGVSGSGYLSVPSSTSGNTLEVDGTTDITTVKQLNGTGTINFTNSGDSSLLTPLKYRYKQVTAADITYNINANESGTRFDNSGATTTTVFNLPLLSTASDGDFFAFSIDVAQSVQINTSGTDVIKYLDNTSINQFSTAARGSFILIYVLEGSWRAAYLFGEWTFNQSGIDYTNSIDHYTKWLNQGNNKEPSAAEEHFAVARNNLVINGFYDAVNNLFISTNTSANYVIREDSNNFKISAQPGATIGNTLDGNWKDAITINNNAYTKIQFPRLKQTIKTTTTGANITIDDVGRNIVYKNASNTTLTFVNDPGTADDIVNGSYGYISQGTSGQVQIGIDTLVAIKALNFNPATQTLYTAGTGAVIKWIKFDVHSYFITGDFTVV